MDRWTAMFKFAFIIYTLNQGKTDRFSEFIYTESIKYIAILCLGIFIFEMAKNKILLRSLIL